VTGPLLQVSHVSRRYPAPGRGKGARGSYISALRDVSFDLAPSTTLAIVGETGSGKSTLARLVTGLESPDSGDVQFRGTSMRDLVRNRRDLGHDIQFVFQDPMSSLDPHLKVSSIVAEGFYALRLPRAERQARVADLIGRVGLNPSVAGNYPHQLSGGERQRVGIARALAAGPQLIVADEPVSSLDASIQGQILNLLKRTQQDAGLAMVFITHDLAVARYMADRLLVMHLGRVVESAAADELFASPRHPYTQALVSAIPGFGQAKAARIVLEGEPPSPVDPGPGCQFASRCRWRDTRCDIEEPELTQGPVPGHEVACHLWREIPELTTTAGRQAKPGPGPAARGGPGQDDNLASSPLAADQRGPDPVQR
jgi:oligopeptide/dipeptide ABC transporter ATP-binding protein